MRSQGLFIDLSFFVSGKPQVPMIIKNAEGVPVTMITTNEGFDLSSNEVNNLTFQLDISRLVPGTYTVSPVVYEVNHLEMNVNLDGLRDIYGFEIYPTTGFNHNMIWHPRYWGYFYNHPIKIEKEENHGSDHASGQRRSEKADHE